MIEKQRNEKKLTIHSNPNRTETEQNGGKVRTDHEIRTRGLELKR